MHSSSRNSVPPRPRRRVEAKPQGHVTKREDKNMNGTLNTVSSSPGRGSRGPPESSRLRAGAQAGRKPVAQPALMRQQQHQGQLVAAKAKPRAGNAVSNLPPPVVDPNCNEPRLPCLCCDGHSPQDSNSLFNHNHNNNNTIAMRHHLGLQAPHGRDEEKVEKEAEEAKEAEQSPDEAQEENIISAASQDKEKAEESPITDDKEKSDEDECDTDIDASEEVDVNGNAEEQQDADDDDDDEDDDDTLVPSCCDCPASMLEFSLSSSTSSSSTSISSCSDFELDCMDTFSLQKQEEPAGYPPRNSTVTQPCTLPLDASMEHISSPCSPDEGYPSAPSSPCSDFTESNGKPGLIGTKMKFLDSIDDIRFYRVVQMAQWDLADEMGLRDRLDHLYRLENVNKQLKMTYLAKLQEGMGFEEEDLSGVLDEMGNTEIPWKLYKGDSQCYSQEFSDAGVDLTAPSDLDEPAADSLAPSPLEPPPRPPKPTTRHIISQPETHTYINISGNSPVMSSTTPPSFSTFSPLPSAKASKKSIPDPPALPPPPSQTVPYFTLYTASPTLASPTPPIPPPRRRHKARLEAQRCAQLQADKSPMSLPPPTSKPPPLPPPPALPSPPKIPPPPSLPPPPSFHALDVEIRKLLALAGLTQAELLKLSPELGVCVSGILVDEDDVTIPEPSRMSQVQEKKVKDNRMQTGDEKGKGTVEMDGWTEKIGGTQGPKAIDVEAHVVEDREANGDTLKTTSFTEMARRRKRNGGSTNSSCSCSSYYSTTNSSASSLESFDHASVLSDTPPPPPPRPLPPCPRVLPEPPELPPLKSCTLPANASRPERFDWLIAFTPDTETPPLEKRKVAGEGTFLKATLGSRVTTFKELRYKSKQSSPPAPSEPEPDPAVITPDPDILYNLKWRKEKSDGDGSQWEYTSQAQASFFRPPPPTPASLALFREMRHLNIEGGGQLETNSSPKIGCSVSEGNLLTMNVEREADGHYRKSEEKASQVRGRADGGRTWESRTAVSSPPLSLVLPHSLPSPYFLHSAPIPNAPLNWRAGFSGARPYNEDGGPHDSPLCHVESSYLHDRRGRSTLNAPHGCSNGREDDHYGKDFRGDALQRDTGDDDIDSLYRADAGRLGQKKLFLDFTGTDSSSTQNQGDTTPYKNIAMLRYASVAAHRAGDKTHVDVDSLYASDSFLNQSVPPADRSQIPSLPGYYLYHPKNCPLHKGAPPRLSPVGAISPPHRSGPLGPGADMSRLCSPLFPRSHTLPALAVPFYFPYLYSPSARAPERQIRPSYGHTVRSLSFTDSLQRGGFWMGEDARAPLRGQGLSSLCLQEKRALVSAVSVAVEAILSQFNSSRTLVQKALSGDSSVNPSLGRLVLQCLCPALRNLLSDGLKPHQSDLIAGRRPNSPWGLVQASTKTGPSTQALHALQCRVAELPQLKQSRHRFNAFLLGLLNIKLLDYWISHLQTCSDLLETYYRPNSFMLLSLTACQPLFEELLLLLQPLSLLTFNLDLLFQHHHLDPASPAVSPAYQSPPSQDLRFRSSSLAPPPGRRLEKVPEQSVAAAASRNLQPGSRGPVTVTACVSKRETSPQLQWLQEKEIAPPEDEAGNRLSQQAGQVIQEGWGAVLRWGERLGQNLGALRSAGEGACEDAKRGSPSDRCSTQDLIRPSKDESQWDRSAALPWGLGRLFGASKSPTDPPAHTPPTRRPSHWLAPSVSVLTRMVSNTKSNLPDKITLESSEEKLTEKEREESGGNGTRVSRPLCLPRAVRTLCDHSGLGAELSFQKGEELVVLGGVDQDWIRCRQGDKEGLVPISYTSLIM
ncbi:uncharacterized protein rusc1 isoform X2 [Denticeps clupeoides]|nr:RUN and SH3 domain-containing protein 1 isoform X2 [Denticeps clupeoides]